VSKRDVKRIFDRKRYQENKDTIKQKNSNYRSKNRESVNAKKREQYNSNKEKISELFKEKYANDTVFAESKKQRERVRYESNKDEIKKRVMQYRKNNKKKANDHLTNRRLNDPKFKLRHDISVRIRNGLHSLGISKNKKSITTSLPYSISELKIHLEKQFEPWMSWLNHGSYRVELWNDNDQSTWTWQIDHIIPHSTFKYSSMDDEEFKKCWSLDNLRPLSAKQNILDGTSRKRH
jgi:hypothetical protein